MGCATSSPFVAVGHGVFRRSNEMADEEADSFGIKQAIIDASQNVGDDIGTAFSAQKQQDMNGALPSYNTPIISKKYLKPYKRSGDSASSADPDFKIIPLKDPNEKMIEDALDEMASTIDETTATLDIKDRSQLQNEQQNAQQRFIKLTTTHDNDIYLEDNYMDKLGTSSTEHTEDMHSFDSFKTTSPEPEIEQAFANDMNRNPPTPQPTLMEMENLRHLVENANNKMYSNMDPKELREITNSFQKSIQSNQNLTVANNNELARIRKSNRRRNFPIYRPRSTRISSKPTKWEERHDRMTKARKKFHRRKSSLSLFSEDSTMFKKPHTLYLVFGNNFLKTPKIKIIESQKQSRWMAKPKYTLSELDVYTGVKTRVDGEEILPINVPEVPKAGDVEPSATVNPRAAAVAPQQVFSNGMPFAIGGQSQGAEVRNRWKASPSDAAGGVEAEPAPRFMNIGQERVKRTNVDVAESTQAARTPVGTTRQSGWGSKTVTGGTSNYRSFTATPDAGFRSRSNLSNPNYLPSTQQRAPQSLASQRGVNNGKGPLQGDTKHLAELGSKAKTTLEAGFPSKEAKLLQENVAGGKQSVFESKMEAVVATVGITNRVGSVLRALPGGRTASATKKSAMPAKSKSTINSDVRRNNIAPQKPTAKSLKYQTVNRIVPANSFATTNKKPSNAGRVNPNYSFKKLAELDGKSDVAFIEYPNTQSASPSPSPRQPVAPNAKEIATVTVKDTPNPNDPTKIPTPHKEDKLEMGNTTIPKANAGPEPAPENKVDSEMLENSSPVKGMSMADLVRQIMKKTDSTDTNSDRMRKQKAKLWLKSLQTVELINDEDVAPHDEDKSAKLHSGNNSAKSGNSKARSSKTSGRQSHHKTNTDGNIAQTEPIWEEEMLVETKKEPTAQKQLVEDIQNHSVGGRAKRVEPNLNEKDFFQEVLERRSNFMRNTSIQALLELK